MRIIARPLLTLERTRVEDDVAAVAQLVAEWQAQTVVVGLPLLPSGDTGEQATRVQAFVRRLERMLDVPIALWDESYTTVEATARMRSRGVSRGESEAGIDAEAAAVILEEWMREHQQRAPDGGSR